MRKHTAFTLLTIALIGICSTTGIPSSKNAKNFFTLAALTEKSQNDRDKTVQPERVMDAIGLKPGMIVGEAGAGTGYFTFKIVKRIGNNGEVYANDILENSLEEIQALCKQEGINNIHTVLGEVADPKFPRNDLDIIFITYAFHMFEKPIEWLENAKKYLRPNATLAMIEPDPVKRGLKSDRVPSKERVIHWAEHAGYILIKDDDFLSEDMLLIFRPAYKIQ